MLTCQAEQNQPVHHQHWPEDRKVEDLEPTAEEADGDRLGCRVPELELWQPADKRPKLLVFLCGESASVAVLHSFILFECRVKFGAEKGEKEV